MSQSKELTDFYKSYLEWIENGAPEYKPYDRSVGLCRNLITFLINTNNEDNADLIRFELIQQFMDAGLDKRCPFGDVSYSYGIRHRTQHLDLKRIQWVKDHIPK